MTDRDQVAREVLTELANWNMARVETLKDATRFRDERYPAPAAPVTVTVEGVTWTKQGDPDGSVWIASVGGPPSRSDAEEFLDRIASDARRIEELEVANASLKAETDRISAMRQDALDELVRVGHERDEARRLYAESEAARVEARRALALANDNTRLWRERVNGLGASITEKGHVERSSTSAPAHTATSQGEGHEDLAPPTTWADLLSSWGNTMIGGDTSHMTDGDGEAGATAASEPLASESPVATSPSPAPIQLGADGKPFDQTMDAKLWAQEFVRLFPAHDEGLMLAWFANAIMRGYDNARAKYEHPVAAAATVKRVALRVKQYNGPTAVSAEGFARIILEELGYTIQEGEA